MTDSLAPRRLLFASLLLSAACEGDGSDIGPSLPKIPDESAKVLVFDDENRAVVSATVSVVGSTMSALTGRNGRGDFLARPRGRLLFEVDPTWAAATEGDTLAGYRVALSVVGDDVPVPLHVPELTDQASAVISAGAQSVSTTVISPKGGELTVPLGASVSVSGGSKTVRISLGELKAQHLPGDLLDGGFGLPFSGTRLFGRGFFIGPSDAGFSPGVNLSVPDDLAVTDTASEVQLYRLDEQTGEWELSALATAVQGRIIVSGAVTKGGLYAFGTDVAARTVEGRVVDEAGAPVFNAMVNIDHRYTTTAGDGRFLLEGVPSTLGDGSLRPANLEVHAGATWLPAIVEQVVPASSALLDVGDVLLDTVRAGNVRVQQVVRARADPFQPARLSTLDGDVALSFMSDESGQVFFEDVPAGFFGFQEGRRRDFRDAFYGQQVGFLSYGQRWLDSYQFLLGRPWFQGTRNSRVYVCDRVGGGPIERAVVVQGDTAEEGYVGETRENGQLFADRAFSERATATCDSARGGSSITHAFTVCRPSSDHLEFPMRRVLRKPLGMFGRHGYVSGTVTGILPGRSHATRVTRRLTRQAYWDAVVDGELISPSYPVDVEIQSGAPDFRVGLPLAGGNFSLVEVSSSGGKDTLEQAAVRADLREGLAEGANMQLADSIPLVPVTSFTLSGSLAGAPTEVEVSTLTLSLGQLVDGAGVVDVARDIGGSVAASGDDLTLGLPPLAAGHAWLALIGGSVSDAGVVSSHHSMVDVADSVTPNFSFQPFPALTAPAPDAEVSPSGFDVEFSLPPGAIGGKIELRSEGATDDDLLVWEAYVRPDQSQFRFVTLPAEAVTPLLAGRDYTLSLTAWFGTVDILSPDVFGDFVAYAQSIAIIEAGVRQVTRRSIQISTL